jgi:hypothetical protein
MSTYSLLSSGSYTNNERAKSDSSEATEFFNTENGNPILFSRLQKYLRFLTFINSIFCLVYKFRNLESFLSSSSASSSIMRHQTN